MRMIIPPSPKNKTKTQLHPRVGSQDLYCFLEIKGKHRKAQKHLKYNRYPLIITVHTINSTSGEFTRSIWSHIPALS